MRRKTPTRKRSVVWLRSISKPIDVWLKHVTRSALRLSGVWLLRCSGA
jgi:hypothetical protein